MLSQQQMIDICALITSSDYSSPEQGISYLCSLKNQFNLSWEDIAAISHQVFNTPWKEKYFRTHYGDQVEIQREETSYEEKLQTLKKERVKLADERIQNGAYIRRLAREETLKEIASEYAKSMTVKPLLNPERLAYIDSCKEGILCISDWHFGIEFENCHNRYNPEIAKKRISKLADKVLDRLDRGDIQKLHIVNLGDMIAGRIHLQLRLESRYDVISQTMMVSEILAEFLNKLSVIPIEYYSCLDNHSRLEPNKAEAMDLESLCRVTDWYLRERLQSNKSIHFNANAAGPDIITFNCLGHRVVGVHGDKDKKTQLERLQLMLGYSCDLLLISHLHHPWMEESNCTKIIGNGTLMGVDEFARGLRLTSRASQNFIVVTPESGCEEMRIIDLQ